MADDMDTLRRSWRRWKAVLGASYPGRLDALRPPAVLSDLQQLRELLGDRWSLHFEALYGENDGEELEATDNDAALLWFADPVMADGRSSFYFMPLAGVDGVLETVGQLNGYDEEVQAELGIPADTVLLPFGCEFSGNFICLGLPPPGSDCDAPVYDAPLGEGRLRIVAPNLARFFDDMAAGGA